MADFLYRDGEGKARSIILTATAAMAGGTLLFEGAHLTGGNFGCSGRTILPISQKCTEHAIFSIQSFTFYPIQSNILFVLRHSELLKPPF